MEKDIGVGVIGIGMGANMLALNNETESRFEVRGICSATESKVKALAKKWSIELAITDYRELLECNYIDVIGIYSY